MIRLHYANRLEGLIPPLAASIAAQQRERPLRRVTIVVPSRVIEQFLKRRISEAIGIAANLDFPFLRRFFADVIHQAEPQLGILDVEDLELVLFESIRAAVRDDFDEFQVLRNYINVSDATEVEREVRTFHLASQLARLFHEYSISRDEMLQSWVRAIDSRDETSDTGKWQKRLWIATFDAEGYLRDELKADRDSSSWILLPAAFKKLSDATLKAALPDTVHVFGLAYVGRAYLRLVSRLGRLTNLNLYALNPCLEFWEDVQHLSYEDRARWVRQHSKVEGDLDKSTDPFNLDDDRDTPALRLWGRPGREYLRMLNELTDCDFEPHFALRDRSAERTLLASVQEDILNRAPQRSLSDPALHENDGSIKFLACPGVAREAEIVANEIWAMLERDERDTHPIRFHQIGVVVPDISYQEYLPHIENAFSRLHQLPMNIVSGSGSESPVREAVDLLLRLPLGRFSREELLHVLNHPAIKSEDAEFESDQARRWCAELGIFFGADAEDLANTYIPSDSYHWDQGIRRLALGVFMDTDRSEEPRFYRAPDSIEYLPCETAQDDGPAAAAFIACARRLLSDVTEIRSYRGTLAQWSDLLGEFLLAHTHVEDPVDERIRERCIEAIDSIVSPELKAAPVSYQVVHEMVTSRIAELEAQTAQFTEHGIVVGPLSALRGIPFRTIFLVGMNEGDFPARDRHDPMDLRSVRRKAADVSPTERDRYLFLETLLAARERLCLSYVARDSKTGTPLEPSSVVRELQFILSGYVSNAALDGLTIEHPLSRYDSEYFPDLAPENPPRARVLRSYDDDARRGAAMAALRNDLARDCGNLPLPGRDGPIYQQLSSDVQNEMRPLLGITTLPSVPPSTIGSHEISLPISALRKFLECPLQGAAKYALRIFEDDDDEDLEQQNEEPIAQSVLNRTNLLREVFWKARGDLAMVVDSYAKAFRISRLVGDAPAGPFARAAERIDHEKIGLWIREARAAGCGSLDRWQEVRMGRGDEFATADRVLGELSITVRAKFGNSEPHARMVRINGSLGFLSAAGSSAVRLVLRDQPKPKDFLGPFLTAIVLAAAGEMTEGRFHALVLGAGKNKVWNESRVLKCPSTERAKEYLVDLLGDLLFGKNHYFLPIEAVDEVDKELGRGSDVDLLDAVNEIRDNEFAGCSSDYGPIRDARRFDPPTVDEMKRIFDRRFSLIRTIFGRDKN